MLPGPRSCSALRLRSHGDREDASHRLLQPTDDTSTREPSDSRLEALASRNRAVCWTPRWRRDRLSASRLRVKARSTTHLQLRPYRSSLVLGRGLLSAGDCAAAFSTACEVDDRPLTLPFALRRFAVTRAASEH